MKPGITHYNPDCLKQLLNDTLPESMASSVVEHLSDCEMCTKRWNRWSESPNWWSLVCSGVNQILAEPVPYSSSGDEITHPPDSRLSQAGHTAELTGDESFARDVAVVFPEPSDNPAMLGRLGEYEILEVIDHGRMGIVLKGFQRELNRYVAVNFLAPHLAPCAAARKRFARDSQATSAVVHPHVMAIHAVNPNAKLPYLVMPRFGCESLQ